MLRLIQIIQLPDAAKTGHAVKIKKDSETAEYVCMLYIHGGHYEPADYHTSNYLDALETARVMCMPQKMSKRFLADYQTAGYSTATMIDAAISKCVTRGEQYGIMHWIFEDGSMLYYNKDKNGWTA